MKIEKNLEIISKDEEKIRVDQFIANNSELTRSMLSGKTVKITIDGKIAKKSNFVHLGETVRVEFEEYTFEGIEKDNIPLDIIYEDTDILVINKPQGMVVHPAPGNYTGTLVNALAYRYGNQFLTEMEKEDHIGRPGIVHRLDKDTSGVMIIALNWKSLNNLSAQFFKHTTNKVYNCIVKGSFIQKRGEMENYIGRNERNRKTYMVVENKNKGKYALSNYRIIEQYEGYALVEVIIHTGRTHQIRVQMKHIGHPIIGDLIYNKKDSNFPEVNMLLYSKSLSFNHPTTHERMTFTAPVPEHFLKTINILSSKVLD